MDKGKRRTWPLGLLGLGVLTAGAWLVSEPSLERQVQARAAQVAQAVSGTQVKVFVRGRDIVLQGTVSSEEARQSLLERVHAQYGVRRIDTTDLQIAAAQPEPQAQPQPEPEPQPKPEPAPKPVATPPAAPTVNTMTAGRAQPEITGRLPEPEKVKRLKVELAGKTYEEGDGHLSRMGDTWVLVPAEPLAEGTYDVKVIAIGEGGASSTDATQDEIIIRFVPPPAPTVKALLTNKAQPQITGGISAPEKVKQLKVELAGQIYTEGDGHLKRDGNGWVLVPAEPLPEGVHDVKVIAIGEGGASSTDTTKDEITVDLTPPAKPVVEELRLAGTQAIMRGTWPEGDGKVLRIIVGDVKYDSDDPNSPLKTDGKGHFTLMLPSSSLPAMRNAIILTADAAGNVAEGDKPTNLGNTCQQQVDDVLIQDMIHFETGKADISEDSLLLLDRLATVLKGCPDMQVEIVGHTDNVGDLQSNQQLSEARANAVKQALVERGVSADSIIARGEGETQPLMPNNSDRNRQINRRIEITVKPKE